MSSFTGFYRHILTILVHKNNMHKIIRMFLIPITLLGLLFPALHTNPALAATILHVKTAATGSGDCSTWANACTLQAALGDSASGDEIWVAAGIHKPHASDQAVSFVLITGVGVYGGFAGTEEQRSQRDIAANPTILSGDLAGNDNSNVNPSEPTRAENAYHVVVGNGTNATAVLDGFTISGGNANSGTPPNHSGGGVLNNPGSPTLRNLTIVSNSAIIGGGMRNGASNPTLTDVIFLNNAASGLGGGMYNNTNSNLTLTNVTFSGNTAASGGGGMYNSANSNPTLANVTFSGNTTSNDGGGMLNVESSDPALTNVIFSNNSANIGGGLYNRDSSPTLSSVTFSGNVASIDGGGMRNFSASSPTLSNVTFSANSASSGGGGMSNNGSSPTLTNVTFSGNSAPGGGGMHNFSSSPTLTNVTFSGNSASLGSGMFNQGSSIPSNPTLTNVIIANSSSGGDCVNDVSNTLNAASSHNLIEDGANACGLANGANGNIIGQDPKLGSLVDNGGATHTHALLPSSPAIDAGTNSGCPASDQRGMTRPVGASCDIGAFELYTGVYHVKTAATGNMDCQSWADACTLLFALKASAAGDEIWVAAGTYTPQASALPASCQEIRTANPTAADGDYAINASGNVFTVYCHNMASTPREYLTLFYNGTNQNFSQYTAGGSSPGTDVRTRYTRIRLNPANLKVDISDQTFAESTGQLSHSGQDQVTSMPYAIAMDCMDFNSQLGLANIDLRGTPFKVTDTFEGNGFQSGGSATKSANDQVVDITGGGFCGWWAPVPAPAKAYNQLAPSFTLELGYIGAGREVSFYLRRGVALFGGFAATESLRSQRDISANPTILSGDLAGNDNSNIDPSEPTRAENAYHVVVGSGTDATAVLDGFTISGGNANAAYPYYAGGGMHNQTGSPELRNITFSANSALAGGGMNNWSNSKPTLTNVIFTGNAATYGGGMSNRESSPTLSNVTFSNNAATNNGGGMINDINSNPTLTNVTFSGNTGYDGGGMHSISSSPTLTNVTFSGNSAFIGGGMSNSYGSPALTNVTFSGNSANSGGGMYNYLSVHPILTNVIIANSSKGGDCVNNASSTIDAASNHNLIEDGANACGLANGVAGNIIGQDPKLGPLVDNGGATYTHALLSGSPAIDAGTNSGCPASDQRGVTRPAGASCDIGAYERQSQIFLPLVQR